jgi:ferredoxin-NADP reductase
VDLASRPYDADITLLYAIRTPEIPFRRLFDDLASKQPRLTIVYTIGQSTSEWHGPVGRIDEAFFREHVPLASMPAFYVSGPKAMVEAMDGTLHTIRVAAEKIKQDYFPGYDS